jgi:hypothetical protein
MKALRLANREFELHRQRRKSAIETLDAVEGIFGDPAVARAEAFLNLLVAKRRSQMRPLRAA